nr:unnamed protein product [Callosobruchus chinensis]
MTKLPDILTKVSSGERGCHLTDPCRPTYPLSEVFYSYGVQESFGQISLTTSYADLSSTLAVTACPKPHKWGDKNFFLSGTSGFSYDFDLYAGSQSNSVPPGAPDLGMSSKMVVKLSESIPKHQNYKLFFDNWFSSVPLMVYLTKEGILSLGRVRLNLVLGADMPKE